VPNSFQMPYTSVEEDQVYPIHSSNVQRATAEARHSSSTGTMPLPFPLIWRVVAAPRIADLVDFAQRPVVLRGLVGWALSARGKGAPERDAPLPPTQRAHG
jgi:hypothetical protein